MPILCPNCGCKEVLWGDNKTAPEDNNQREQEQEEISSLHNQAISPTTIREIFEPTLTIKNSEGRTLDLESDGLNIFNRDKKIASLVICKGCGTLYNCLNDLDSFEKVKRNKKQRMEKQKELEKNKYRFISKK